MADEIPGLSLFTGELRQATSAAVGLGGELLSGSQKLSDYSAALVGNTKILGNLGKVVNGLVQFAEQSLEEYQTLSGIGASFGKDMTQIKVAAAELGMTVADMSKFLMDNSESLRSFGGTTDQAISRFRNFSKEVLDSQVGTELRRLGYTAADINETLVTYNEIAQQDGLNNRRSSQEQAQAAQDFAIELDRLSKLTGKQRADLAEEMKEARARGNVQALLMGKSADQQEAFTRTMTELKNTLGPQYEQLFLEMAQFGAPISKSAQQAYLTLGSAQDEFEGMVANAMDPNGLASSVEATQGAFLNYQKTQESANLALLSGVSDIGDAAAQGYESSYAFANAMDAAAEAGESPAEALERTNLAIAEEQLTQMQNTGGIIDATIQMQEAVRDLTVTAMSEVMPRLESMAMQGIQMFLDNMPSSQEIAAQLGGAVGNLFNAAEASAYRNEALDALNNFMQQYGTTDTSLQEQQLERLGANTEAVTTTAEEEEAGNNERHEATQAALEEARAQVAETEENLAALQAQQDRLIAEGNTASIEAAADIETQIRETEASLQQHIAEAARASAAEAAARLNVPLATSGRAEGGSIAPGEIAMVGEAGPEFMAGPGMVMSAKTSMGVMGNLMRSIRGLQQNVQSQDSSREETISTIREAVSSTSSMSDQKLEQMIQILGQIARLQGTSGDHAKAMIRATKGLQGNMLKGIGA